MAPARSVLRLDSPKRHLRSSTFRQVLAHSLQALRPLAMKLAGSYADAEDLLQATCLRALEGEQRLQDHSNIVGWLCRIMRNLQIDACRARSRRTTLPEHRLAAEPPEGIALWRLVDDEEVRALVPTLSEHLQAVWRLHHEEGLDQNEIAVRLGIPRATVATRVFRARLVMRLALLRSYGQYLEDDQAVDVQSQLRPEMRADVQSAAQSGAQSPSTTALVRSLRTTVDGLRVLPPPPARARKRARPLAWRPPADASAPV